MTRGSWIWLSVAVIVALVALAWPLIEEKIMVNGKGCPYSFQSIFSSWSPTHFTKVAETSINTPVQDEKKEMELKSYTEQELRQYDGTNPDLPILLSIGGKIVDVTSGAHFYGVGKGYHIFAGRVCTRALSTASLKEEVSHCDTNG